MKKQYTHKPIAIRFRRWSRKGYAAFVSVQHIVTIGQLATNVSERIQTKYCSIHASILSSDLTNDMNGEEDILFEADPEDRLSLLCGQTTDLVQTTDRAASSSYAYSIQQTFPKAGITRRLGNTRFSYL